MIKSEKLSKHFSWSKSGPYDLGASETPKMLGFLKGTKFKAKLTIYFWSEI